MKLRSPIGTITWYITFVTDHHARRTTENDNKGAQFVLLLLFLTLLLQVFRKYSNSLGPDALELVEQILDENGIDDNAIELSLETLAKEYNKQDGKHITEKLV